MTRRTLVLVALALALASRAGAQEIVLSGTVRATDGAPLRGVSVHLVDTQLRAMTDADGKYSLSVPTDGVVAFTLTGRRPRQLQALSRGRPSSDIRLSD